MNHCKKYALIVPTSMGVRITPANNQPVYASDIFKMQATSAETNVASIPSYLGLPVKVLTKFVKNSPIAEFIKRDLRSRGMDIEAPEIGQGGPWGYRHQFNIADSGFGVRGPRVCNDRAGEVGQTLCADDFDLGKIFVDEGAEMLHLSGLIAALSPSTGELCVKLAQVAHENGTPVSFDLNYRASFWAGREAELTEIFRKIASCADILIGNEEDFQLCFGRLGLAGPDIGTSELGCQSTIERFKTMIDEAGKLFPNVGLFATTLREVESASTHLWGAIMRCRGKWYVVEPKRIEVLDRIGGGDGFVGGLLYAILKGYAPEKQIEFAWACGALAVTFETDYAQPIDEEQILSIASGNARVRR